MPKPQDNTTLFTAMFGAAVAAGVTTASTYPLEYLKTLSQLENKAITTKSAIVPYDSMKPIFSGCSALAFGMALKGCGRMWVFNQLQKFMSDGGPDGNATSAPRVVVAGLMTGSLETLLVIPFENIKVRLIESSMITYGWRTKFDEPISASAAAAPVSNTTANVSKTGRQLPPGTLKKAMQPPLTVQKNMTESPQIKALMHYHKNPSRTMLTMVKEIYQTSGPFGFFRGSFLTVFRQMLNSAVWYTTYSAMQQMIDPSRDSITELELIGMGFGSSLAVVAVTQPIDLIKTRMQSRDGVIVYKNVMNCIATTFFNEGVKTFWLGSIPRFVKVSCSSSVTLVVYEWVTKSIDRLSDSKPFAS